jgi:hypothetical protein
MRSQCEGNANAEGGATVTRDEIVQKRIAETGPLYKTIMLKAFEGTASPRAAIKAFCIACTGEDRQAIKGCTGYSCNLWKYRPYQEGEI